MQAARNLQKHNVEPIDGSYLIPTGMPCVDHKTLFAAKTKAQRNAMRTMAAHGKFCGFLPVSALT